MTNSVRVSSDIRIVSAALAANDAITLPALITATGRAAPSQSAIVPAGTIASFALLPFADFDDDPDQRPGGGFAGGRIASFVPFLKPGALAPGDLRVALRPLPASREAIRQRLRVDAGLWWAPGALFSLAAWEDESVYVWLDHLRLDGTEARLIIAHAQAMLAVRRLWLWIIWGVGTLQSTIPGLLPSPVQQGGAIAVGRALLDVVRILLRLVDDTVATRTQVAAGAASAAPLRRIRALLGRFVDLVADADKRPEQKARKKLGDAIKAARTLLDAVAVFSVAAEPLDQRWRRLDKVLSVKQADPGDRLSLMDLAAFDARLDALAGAQLGTRLEATTWPNYVRRSLLRLASSDPVTRLAALDRIRCDLLYRSLITRRLDRPYALFPWLAASHAAFLHCAGGALGALASLLECARRMEVARELKRQVADVLADPNRHSPATVARLTIPAARKTWQSRYRMTVAVDRGYAAGIALEQGAISHASIKAALNGAYYCPDYPITALRFGRLGWSLPAAMSDRRTVAAVQRVEQARPVMRLVTHDPDVPRHLGMTIKRLLAETIVSVFPDHDKGDAGTAHRLRAVAAARTAGRPATNTGQTLYTATQQLFRSMLLTLDKDPATDPRPRDAIADQIVEPPLAGKEVDRVETRRSRATRRSVAKGEHEKGQGIRRDATHEPTVSDGRGALLRALADDVARWREPARPRSPATLTPLDLKPRRRSKPPSYAGPPRDDQLNAILCGRTDLGQLTPVGALALPLLWCAPLIDLKTVAWIARGAPAASAPRGPVGQAEAVAAEVARAHGWASLLYTRALPTCTSVRAACHLFTGHSTITADLSHV